MPLKPSKEKPAEQKKIKTNRFFSSIFHPSTRKVEPQNQILPEGVFPLLDLPRPVRLRIWKLLGFSHTKTLRLVCSLVKEDIDQFSGISSAIDSTFEDFPFHCNIAIRKVAIHELIIPNYIEFLKYPNLLEELEIRGEISLQNFHCILKSCPNISKLLVVFNKFVLDYKTALFPLPAEILNLKPLSKLRSIKMISATKKANEMAYVSLTIVGLLRDTLRNTNIIDSVHLCVAHKNSNAHFEEVVKEALVFIHKHAPRLRYLSLALRDRDPNVVVTDFVEQHNDETEKDTKSTNDVIIAKETNKSLANFQPGGTEIKDRKSIGNNKPEVNTSAKQPRLSSLNTKRDTKTIPLPPGVVITHHVKDIHSEDPSASVTTSPEGEGEANVEPSTPEKDTSQPTTVGTVEACLYSISQSWPKANKLERLLVSASAMIMVHILEMISSNTPLQFLELEMVGGGILQSSWEFYTEFLHRSNPCMLQSATFRGVNNVDLTGCPLSLDLSVLQECKNLKALTIIALRRSYSNKQSCATGVSKLPKTLNEIYFERVLLTPWQVTRLLICFGDMLDVSISYWSISDCQFCMFMTVLRWVILLKLTDVPQIILVDTKLRFRNKRKAVRKLQQAVSINVRYHDLDETKLVINASQKQDDMAIAPRISLHKISTTSLQNSRQQKREKQKAIHRKQSLQKSAR